MKPGFRTFGHMSDTAKNVQRIKAAMEGSFHHVKPLLKRLHPTEIARILEVVSPETRKKIISILPVEIASETLSEMDEENAARILAELTPSQAAELIEELDPDDAADLLSNLPKEELRLIFDRISDEEEKVIETLMTYDEESAGGIMTPEVIKVRAEWTKTQAIKEIIIQAEEIEDFYFVFVVDDENHLEGVIPINALLTAKSGVKMEALTLEKTVTVHVDQDQEEAARLLSQYNLPAIPVVDEWNRLLGRITFDDVFDVFQEESTEDLLKIAGVSETENLRSGWFASVKSRIPWLVVNLLTASTAGFVISLFETTIQAMAYITAFMPVIAGVAGNGATQTLAVTIRRIATDGVSPQEYFPVVIKEIIVGIVNGLLIGMAVALLALATRQDPMLGGVVFLAMTGNLIIAGFAGSSVPLILQRLGVDPAVASSILITAFTDILGYLLLLGLGTIFLM